MDDKEYFKALTECQHEINSFVNSAIEGKICNKCHLILEFKTHYPLDPAYIISMITNAEAST